MKVFYEGFDSSRREQLMKMPQYVKLMPKEVPAPKAGEMPKHYVFDATGHIMASTTAASGELSPQVQLLFKKAITFFSAIVDALSKNDTNSFDYKKVGAVITGSGLFVRFGCQDRTFKYISHDLTLSIAIIRDVIGNLSAVGSALEIAELVISSIGAELKAKWEKSELKVNIAHPLLTCEEILGVPLVTMSLFYLNAEEAKSVSKTNCHEKLTSSVTIWYHQEDYLFVDPEYINQFTEEFRENEKFKALVDKLATCAG